MLATASDNASHCSYVPCIWINGKVYILVSGLAEHTGNLKHVKNNKIGCMLIEDESASPQIFARCRLMFKSGVKQIERTSKLWPEIITLFKQRFGEIVEVLDSLPDFVIIELKPEQAVLVKGFGDAHQLSEEILNNTGG